MSSGIFATQDILRPQDFGRRDGGFPENRLSVGYQARIVIISDARLYREGLALSLERIDSVLVVGSADSLESALICIDESGPDVALLDIGMPHALTLPSTVAAAQALVKIVAFSVAETVDDICACAEAGIAGYVPRHGSTKDLVAAVENAIRGEVACSPLIAASLFRRLAVRVHTTREAVPALTLTGREHEIIILIDRGLSNKEIARLLKLSPATVKNHVHNILEKLHVRCRGAAAAVLREAGNTSTPRVTS